MCCDIQLFRGEYPDVEFENNHWQSVVQIARARAGVTEHTGQVQQLLTFLVKQCGPTGVVDCHLDMDWDKEDETLTRLFYASNQMVASFRKHGQWIAIDATCKTNRFNMPLVFLVGIDDLHKTTIFGFALILTEDITSYTWVLDAFKEIVGITAYTHTVHTQYLCSTQAVHFQCACSTMQVHR